MTKKKEPKENNFKKLRDFIRAHEMRYYVIDGYDQVHIGKAFKVEMNNSEYWIHFSYGDRPCLLTSNDIKYRLFKTEEDAKTKAEQLRKTKADRKAKEDKEKKDKFKEVTEYLRNFRIYDIKNWKSDEIKPEGKPFAEAIIHLYNEIPKKQKYDNDFYGMVVRYLRTGTFESQGLMFRKEHVVCVRYGKFEAVQIELINGLKITPVSRSLSQLIRIVFGDNDSGWSYNKVSYPKSEHDDIEERK